ncbi:MAG: hypothetical protein FWG91_07325 [Lachnospiraceae bacterium]|nr:hypothetical protein [Lachnospiraceae bacterium]
MNIKAKSTLSIALVSLMLTSCSSNLANNEEINVANNPNQAEMQMNAEETFEKFYTDQTIAFTEIMNLNLSQLISLSDYIVKARCLGNQDMGDFTKTFFEAEDIVNSTPMGRITVYQYPVRYQIEGTDIEYDSGLNEFTEGNNYILVLEEDSSVFYDETKYRLLGDFYAKLDDSGNIIDFSLYADSKTEKMFSNISEARQFANESKIKYYFERDKKVPFTSSSNKEDIIEIADYILTIEILGIAVESPDRTSYEALVIDSIKDMPDVKEIFAVLPRNSVEIGKQYIVAFNRVNETSLVFVISSLNGIYDVKEAEALKELLDK